MRPPVQIKLMLAVAFTILLNLSTVRLDPITVIQKDALSENLARVVAHEGSRRSFASTVYDWASNLATNVASKFTLAPRTTPLDERHLSLEKEISQVLDEVTAFSKAVKDLEWRVMDSNTFGSPDDKMFFTSSLRLLRSCYRDILNHIRNQLNEINLANASSWLKKIKQMMGKPKSHPMRDGDFQEVMRGEFERKVGELKAKFVSNDEITIGQVDLEIIVNWENILIRGMDFFYRQRFISLDTLRDFFKDSKALKKLAIRTMNHSPKSTTTPYPNYYVAPNLRSMNEYWELLYSVTIIRALDKESQTVVTYFALVELLEGVIQDSERDPASQLWIETVAQIVDHSFLDKLASWFENPRVGLDLNTKSSTARLQELEGLVWKLMESFQRLVEDPDPERQHILWYQHLCTFHTLDFINTHYGSALFEKSSVQNSDYDRFMNQLGLMKAATRFQELIKNVFEYAGLVSHGLFKNKHNGLKLYPNWDQYYWTKIIPASHQFQRLYDSRTINHQELSYLETMLGRLNRRAGSLEQIHHQFVAMLTRMPHHPNISRR